MPLGRMTLLRKLKKEAGTYPVQVTTEDAPMKTD
jgi:hypothetical protein